MRIAHYLAKSGLGARRKTEELVRAGKVTVNGKTVTDFSFDVAEDDLVIFEGNKVELKPKVYYLLNKPAGYTCSLADEHAEKLVTELVPKEPAVWPVGRLDRDTEGLLVLTNDGDLTYKLTHPKFEKEKEYEVVLDRNLDESELTDLRNGIELEDGLMKPDSATFDGKKYGVIIHSGRKRIVRRLFSHFDRQVVRLKRTRLANIHLDGLGAGEWRALTEDEKRGLDV